jgi:enoyl-CoA hydratase
MALAHARTDLDVPPRISAVVAGPGSSMPSPAEKIELRFQDRAAGARVGWVTVDNEARRNALTSSLMAELVDIFMMLAKEAALRAVVLTGAGEKAFIGGVDIEELAKLDAAQARGFITRLHAVCQAIRDLPVPVIARIQGYALGGGLEIAASCDLRLASKSARFGMPEVRLGIPSVIEAALLPRLVGWGWTRRLLLLGEMISAQEAFACGLLEKLVEDAQLDRALEEWLTMLVAAGPKVIRAQKALISQWEDASIGQAIEKGIEAFTRAYEGGEPEPTMRAFLDARRRRHKPL